MENPSQQPQYFRFNESSQDPAPKQPHWRPETLKRGAVIAGVMLVLILGGIFLTNVVKNMGGGGVQSALEATEEEVAQRQADCEEGDEVCVSQAQTSVARASGIAEACKGLEEKKLVNCVMLIATEEKEKSACNLLEDEDRIMCEDAVLLARADAGEGMSICEEIQDATIKAACQTIVTSTARAQGNCAKYGVEESVCDMQEQLEALLASGDYAGCAELPEEERVQCIEMFSSTDADKDGLTAEQEAEAGTSDAQADTDGDGYDDYTEVKAGYNPLN